MKKRMSVLVAALCLLLCFSCQKKVSMDGCARFDSFRYEGMDPRFDTVIDVKSQFLNPILAGYYPDPSICRKGETYYMVNSSFSHFPGVPIFTSSDLVHWTQIGHVLDRPSQLMLTNQEISQGIYAPAIEYNPYNDTFYMITTDVGGKGNFFVKTKDPSMGWSDPILLPEVTDIDPSFFFDEDGKAYIVHNNVPEREADWEQQRAIRIHEFDVANDCTVGRSKEIVRGGVYPDQKPIWIEGPHLYKINGWYYLMCAEGGTAEDHSEVIFRSRSPWGPYVAAAYNPILTQRDLPLNRDDMVAFTGHADLIQTPEGDWWAVFLGVRPYDGNVLFNTGRETFLLPVEWENGFPIILRKGEAVPTVVNKNNLQPAASPTTGNFVYEQDFDQDTLDPSWAFIRTPQEDFYSMEKGMLCIRPLAINTEERKSPSALLRRQQHSRYSVETRMDYTPYDSTQFGGMTLFQNEQHQFLFGKTIMDDHQALVLVRIEGGQRQPLAHVLLNKAEARRAISLRVTGTDGMCDFHYSMDGKQWNLLYEKADATHLSTQKAGGFVGTFIGLYASANHPM